MTAAHKPSVCIVDDNEAICLLLSEMLEETGISATAFTNPVKAIDFLSFTRVDLVVSDYHMPEMNGIQFLDTVRQLHPGIMVLLMSSALSEISGNKSGYPVIEKPVGFLGKIAEIIFVMCSLK
jgi:CheY-like chemotaxis protein